MRWRFGEGWMDRATGSTSDEASLLASILPLGSRRVSTLNLRHKISRRVLQKVASRSHHGVRLVSNNLNTDCLGLFIKFVSSEHCPVLNLRPTYLLHLSLAALLLWSLNGPSCLY